MPLLRALLTSRSQMAGSKSVENFPVWDRVDRFRVQLLEKLMGVKDSEIYEQLCLEEERESMECPNHRVLLPWIHKIAGVSRD